MKDLHERFEALYNGKTIRRKGHTISFRIKEWYDNDKIMVDFTNGDPQNWIRLPRDLLNSPDYGYEIVA